MSRVEIAEQELRIDGIPRTLLCASVFPFRIPREQWEARLAAVRDLGYHAIDVYVPWNLHESQPGVWDFTGDLDISHFLALAAQQQLLVVARPGPYICSEWDGGGLPAWLSLEEGLRVRQNEARYLAQVERWFDHILPVLERHQLGRDGTVVLVQLENELDFFDCDDPTGYLGALAASARRHGIIVPLIACAGQGDVVRAAGQLDDVVPAVNLYPSDESATIEALTQYYRDAVAERGYPLLVTETNRLHRTLKRLVASGARLLGPYLQASGWNPGYGTAVNNWGDVLGFMTHDYDFGGAIDPDGAPRADAAAGKRLSRIIDSLGPRLASSRPLDASHRGGLPSASSALSGGGVFYSLTELDGADRSVRVDDADPWTVLVPGGETLLLVQDLPLPSIGATLVRTDAELVGLSELRGEVMLTFAADRAVGLLLRADAPSVVRADPDIRIQIDGDLIRVEAARGRALIAVAGGSLELVFEPADVDTDADVVPVALGERLRTVLRADAGELWRDLAATGPAIALERHGVYRGAGRYETQVPAGTCGVVLGGASDIVSVTVDAKPRSWFANGGTDVWMPWDVRDTDASLIVETRVWGHSNFDDGRLPSLRLGSLRGLDGALAVRSTEDVSEGWSVSMAAGVGTEPRPLAGLGGWMTARFPQTVTYRRAITADGAIALHRDAGQGRVDVFLRGEHRGALTPLVDTLLLGAVTVGDELRLEVTRTWGEEAGRLSLLHGHALTQWDTQRQDAGVLGAAASAITVVTEASFPIEVAPGDAAWLRLDDARVIFPAGENAIVRFEGRGLLVTAVVGDELLGRVWVGTPQGALLKGGRGDVLLIPAARARHGVHLLVEATDAHGGSLDRITVGGPIDLPDASA